MLVLSVLKKTFKSLYLYEILYHSIHSGTGCNLKCKVREISFPLELWLRMETISLTRHFVIHCLWFQNHHFLQWRAQRPFFRGICKVILKVMSFEKAGRDAKGSIPLPYALFLVLAICICIRLPIFLFPTKREKCEIWNNIHVKFI